MFDCECELGGSQCGLCDTYYIAHVKNACAFLGDGMSRIEVSTLSVVKFGIVKYCSFMFIYHIIRNIGIKQSS